MSLQDICLSGGADGADLQWGMVAGAAGHMVVHWSFAGHRSMAPPAEIVVLDDAQLQAADEFCLKASKTLKRHFPPKSLKVQNLLRRNWYQVKDAERVYAVVEKVTDGIVAGGTAWATQMFIDRHQGKRCECYIFDQETDSWYRWDEGWFAIGAPPMPHGVWAGVGTRKLTNGKIAIRTLMNWKNSPSS